jgi:hypothetical protein
MASGNSSDINSLGEFCTGVPQKQAVFAENLSMICTTCWDF